MQSQFFLLLTFNFLIGYHLRTEIGYCRTKNTCIGFGKVFFRRYQHFAGRLYINAMNAGMLCFQLHGSRYQCHLRSTTCTFFREGKPHFSGRIVTDKTDRVNLLISRPGCNHYFLTLQLTVCRKKFIQHTDDILRFLHTSLPYKMTGKLTRTRLDNMIAVRTKYLQILLSGRMSIHIEVHSRSYKHRSFRRKIGRYQHIISYPVCHFANGRGSGGSYQHRICPQSEVNVAVPRSVTLGKEFTDDRFAGQSR